jgi:hypothetical protein
MIAGILEWVSMCLDEERFGVSFASVNEFVLKRRRRPTDDDGRRKKKREKSGQKCVNREEHFELPSFFLCVFFGDLVCAFFLLREYFGLED